VKGVAMVVSSDCSTFKTLQKPAALVVFFLIVCALNGKDIKKNNVEYFVRGKSNI